MPTYAIGDVHGCFDSLQALLERLPFDPDHDRLWMVGDLVNRGPRSLETLRWARGMEERMGERFAVVLGNHDLHLLRRALGLREDRPLDTLEPVIEADDGEELVEWLAHRQLLHRENGWVMLHAGLAPGWTLREATWRARRAETALRSPNHRRTVLGPGAEGLSGHLAQARETLAVLASLRCLDVTSGEVCDFSGHPDDAPAGCVPWFRHPRWRAEGEAVVFGHWSALGFHREPAGPRRQGEEEPPVVCLDSGCVWGRGLTALRLDDGEVFRQETLEPPDALPGKDW